MPEPLPTAAELAQAPMIASLTETLSLHGVRKVTRIDTQGAIVLLAGDEALKIRRAILLPFLDYSTLAKRKAAAEREVERNRAAAPGISVLSLSGASARVSPWRGMARSLTTPRG